MLNQKCEIRHFYHTRGYGVSHRKIGQKSTLHVHLHRGQQVQS